MGDNGKGSVTVTKADIERNNSIKRMKESEWNELDPEIRLAPSVATFKSKLLSIIRSIYIWNS